MELESEGSPKRRERKGAVISCAVILLLFLTVGGLTQMMNAAFGLFFVPFILFGGVTWVALRRQGRAPMAATRARHFSPVTAWQGFLFGIANFFAVVVPLQLLVSLFVPAELRELYDSTHVFEGQTQLELVLIVLAVVVAAPLGEEFFFRGFLQRAFARSGLSPLHAVVITAVIFSAFHLDPVGFLARVELGVLFGLLLVYTGSLWPAIAAHAANNLISTAIYFAGKNDPNVSAAATPGASDLAQLGVLVVAGGLGLFALLRWAKTSQGFSAMRDVPDEPSVSPEGSIPRSLFALSAPWITAGVLAIATLAAVDPLGVRLNLLDARTRLPKLPENAPEALREERSALKALRQEVRFGDAPLELYEERRKALLASPDAGVPEAPSDGT